VCWSCCASVPSAPRSLRLTLIDEDPPVVHMSWQAPVFMHGTLTSYQLIYGISGDEIAEQRHFDADKQHFTTTFLGTLWWLTLRLKPWLQLRFDYDTTIPRRFRLRRKWSKLRYAFDSTAIRLWSDYDVSCAPASIRREQKMNMTVFRRSRVS